MTQERNGQGSVFDDLPAEVSTGLVGLGHVARDRGPQDAHDQGGTPDKPRRHRARSNSVCGTTTSRWTTTAPTPASQRPGSRARNIRPVGGQTLTGGLSWWPVEFIRLMGNAVVERYDDPLLAPVPGQEGKLRDAARTCADVGAVTRSRRTRMRMRSLSVAAAVAADPVRRAVRPRRGSDLQPGRAPRVPHRDGPGGLEVAAPELLQQPVLRGQHLGGRRGPAAGRRPLARQGLAQRGEAGPPHRHQPLRLEPGVPRPQEARPRQRDPGRLLPPRAAGLPGVRGHGDPVAGHLVHARSP